MEIAQVIVIMTIIVSNMAGVLFLYFKSDHKIEEMRKETNDILKGIAEEMKDFHSRLATQDRNFHVKMAEQDFEFKMRLTAIEERVKMGSKA